MATSRTLLILGAQGDLTSRLLLPGLGQLLASQRRSDIEILGVDRAAVSDPEWRALIGKSFTAAGVDLDRVRPVLDAARYVQADATDASDLSRVIQECHGVPAFYFALPPRITVAACSALRHLELPEGTVLALEKPFGVDEDSAARLNRQLVQLVPEQQIQRVDHFLGKSTVLNLLGLRFANRIFESVWNSEHIERVEIRYDEALGLEGRAGYYDGAGALVDMIQSHLLLVMALVAIEPPSTLHPEDLRGAMAQVLRAVRPIDAGRRARYTAGEIGGRSFPSYVDEPGVDPSRNTETLAEVNLAIDNWRWAGVPFRLRSGKAVGDARKDIVVTFREVPHLPTGFRGSAGRPILRIALAPDRLDLDVTINGAGDPFELDRVSLGADFGQPELIPYGEVLHGILNNDPLLSVRGDIAEECWRVVDAIRADWQAGRVPLEDYAAGSPGPSGWD